MSKQTISSLVRVAARSESEFLSVIEQVFAEEPAARIAEFDLVRVPLALLTSPG